MDDNIQITGPAETRRLFEYRADISDDKPLTLPIITLTRGNDIEILSTNKKPLTYDGMTMEANTRKSAQLNGIPIKLTYQIDIYTKFFKEADEYLRNFIFKLINFPKLLIQIPYNGANIEHTSNIILDTTVTDNSDIPERLVPGQFTRMTLSLTVDDAWLFDYKIRNNYTVEYDWDVVLESDRLKQE